MCYMRRGTKTLLGEFPKFAVNAVTPSQTWKMLDSPARACYCYSVLSKVYLGGEVAKAIGVPHRTLLTWCQRGFLDPISPDRTGGEWREFTVDGVAYAAVFAFIAEQEGPSIAGRIMAQIVDGQFRYWSKRLVPAALKGEEIHIFAKRFRRRGELLVGARQPLVRRGRDDSSWNAILVGEMDALADPTVEGECIGDPRYRRPGEREYVGGEAVQHSIMVFRAGAVIIRAIRALENQAE